MTWHDKQGILNKERYDEIEFLVQKLSDDHGYSRETVATIVTACFHRLGDVILMRGDKYVLHLFRYGSERKIASGTWSYLDEGLKRKRKVKPEDEINGDDAPVTGINPKIIEIL